MTYTEKIIDLITGKETLRPYTAEEIATVEEAQARATAEVESEAAEQAAKDAAKQAVLDKLGLSADEIAALLA